MTHTKQLYYTNKNTVTIHYTTRSKKQRPECLMIKRCHRVIRSTIVKQQLEKVFWWKLNDILRVEQIVMSI